MTQEEKQLLLKDLCARLPHYTMVLMGDGGVEPLVSVNVNTGICNGLKGLPKPYLRPVSSMTDEEKREVGKLGVCNDGAFHNDIYDIGISMEEAFAAISWLLERHFDINYLIEKGLALEAKEGMYKID
jgi:hypothetical protein